MAHAAAHAPIEQMSGMGNRAVELLLRDKPQRDRITIAIAASAAMKYGAIIISPAPMQNM
jgi:hypothetical protein